MKKHRLLILALVLSMGFGIAMLQPTFVRADDGQDTGDSINRPKPRPTPQRPTAASPTSAGEIIEIGTANTGSPAVSDVYLLFQTALSSLINLMP